MAVEISRTRDGILAQVRGIPELREALLSIPVELRKGEMLRALRAGAAVVRGAARAAAPVLQRATRYRTKGLLRKKISIRTSKMARQRGNIGVFVNVRPAKGASYGWTPGIFGTKLGRKRVMVAASQRGAKSKDDPFYWRFVEFGWRSRGKGNKMRGAGFLKAGGEALPAALDQIQNYFDGAMTRMSARLAAKARRLSR